MKILRLLLSDRNGVSVLVEYMLIVGILALLMAFIVPQLSTLMSRMPTANAMKNQFQDVASEISAQITDMLLVSPKNGIFKSKVYMPAEVGKETYSVELSNNELIVKSNIWTQKENIGRTTLGFITKGRTFSSEITHEILLNSSIHLLPTAVAIVHPTEAAVGENITLDMTHSYGEGTLYYRWIITGQNYKRILFQSFKEYDPVNPDTGITTWNFSSTGNYTITLEVKDSLGYVSYDCVNVSVVSNPQPELYIDKYVVPASIAPGESSTVNIFLFGNGINQSSTNITVIHTIDASGSMNDYTPYSSVSGNVTSSPSVIGVNINNSNYDYLIFVTTSDFDTFYYSYGIRPISLYVKSPNQDYYVQASDVWNVGTQDGYGYVITNPDTGTWYLAINDLNPKSDESVDIYVYKGIYYPFGWFDVYGTVYSNTTTAYRTYSTYGIKVPPEATELGVQLIPTQAISSLYLWLEDNVSGTWILNTTGFWINVSYPSSGYTAYVVPNFPPSTTGSYYLKTYIPKIDAVKIAAKTFNGFLRKYDYVGVVKFNNYQATYVVNPPTNDTDAVNTSIDSITASGWTPMASGIEYAINELNTFNDSKNSPAVNVIILLSDGNANIDLNGKYNVKQAILDTLYEAEVAKDDGYIIYTIGYGSDANVTLLQQIAEITGGKFYFAANTQELEDIYKSIAKDVLTKVAENVTVTDVVPPDVSVLSVSGTANVTKTKNGTVISWVIPVVRINQSWFGSITITTTRTGVVLTDVANVSNLTYYDVVKSKTVTVPLPVRELNVSATKSASFELK